MCAHQARFQAVVEGGPRRPNRRGRFIAYQQLEDIMQTRELEEASGRWEPGEPPNIGHGQVLRTDPRVVGQRTWLLLGCHNA